MPFATLDSSGKRVAATATPISRMTAVTRRLTRRRRVRVAGESSPRATSSLRRSPRFAIKRSAIWATMIATPTEIPASTQSLVLAAAV